ncbi:unnamed protein product [Cuscuta epithymum]|uniref:Peptidase C1A papain C-terminal domain-containing protein n=1 Tax=Cuscuta epithymum TaxID=186058 RepID=A0AAV0F6Z3_9ASTE|nr:unnamed protein product [Cuscuta epithymum]
MAFKGCPGVEDSFSLTNTKGLLQSDVVCDEFGFCHAYASAEVVGAVYAYEQSLKTKTWPVTHIPLSAQQLIDALPYNPEIGMVNDYIKNYGITTKSDYDNARAINEELINIHQMIRYRPSTVTNIKNSVDLKRELRRYPLVGVIDTASESLHHLKRHDIYASNGIGDHAVILTGYGTVRNQKCYEFKNSWGVEWACDGYGLVERDAVLSIWRPKEIQVVEPELQLPNDPL